MNISVTFTFLISTGISTGISCMAPNCVMLAPEDFILNLITRPTLRDKYQQFTFQDYVKSHPHLRFCPGPNCQVKKFRVFFCSFLSKEVFCWQNL